jgi:hypothetical protein
MRTISIRHRNDLESSMRSEKYQIGLKMYSRIKLIPDHQHPRPLPRIPNLAGSQLYASSLTGDLEYPPIGFLEPSVLRDGRSRGKEVG